MDKSNQTDPVRNGLLMGFGILGGVVILMIIVICCCCKTSNKKSKMNSNQSGVVVSSSGDNNHFVSNNLKNNLSNGSANPTNHRDSYISRINEPRTSIKSHRDHCNKHGSIETVSQSVMTNDYNEIDYDEELVKKWIQSYSISQPRFSTATVFTILPVVDNANAEAVQIQSRPIISQNSSSRRFSMQRGGPNKHTIVKTSD